MDDWIRPPGVVYDETDDLFFMTNKSKDLILQSPLPLSKGNYTNILYVSIKSLYYFKPLTYSKPLWIFTNGAAH